MFKRILLLSVGIITPTLFIQAKETTKTFSTFVDSLGSIANNIIALIAAAAVMTFLWGLAGSMINPGDSKKQQSAKDFMLWGTIGFVVMGSLYGIVNIIKITIVSGGL